MSNEDELQALRILWYEKLKKTGFKDCESLCGKLKDYPNARIPRAYTTDQFIEKQSYYRAASEFYWVYKFSNNHEKKIWQLHSEGFSTREISKKLRTKSNSVNKDNVNIVIYRLARIMRTNLEED